MKPFLVTLFSLFSLFAQAQDSFLTISTGGGFTGVAIVYKVDESGKVLKGKGIAEVVYTEESKVKKATIKKCFRKAKSLFRSTSGFIHPGNLYYSIALNENDKESTITWGNNEYSVPEDAKRLYHELTSILTSLTFTVIPPNQL